MQQTFFPRDKQFWIYHLSVLSLIQVITLITTILWSNRVAIDIVNSFLVMFLLTVNVLLFRYFYKKKNWNSLSIPKSTLIIFIYGSLTSLVTVGLLLIMIGPYYLPELIASQLKYSPESSVVAILIRVTYGHVLQQQLIICAWLFIYIAITNNRRAKSAELDNLRLQNSLKEATLTNLASQLNPHFLFNTLNNIRFMLHDNPQQADEMIIALSDILRYSLQGSQKEKLPLAEEIEIIERYLAIIKVQFEDRLQLDINIPHSLHQYLLPPLVLQMLVENAIKHGLDNIREGGKLKISAEENKQKIIFKVINDIPYESNDLVESTGIGLSNIKQRLRLLYGNNGQLVIDKTEQQFKVILSIPKEVVI
jgi:sensor histidine kinase YesM